jgi:hypothetical protein
LLVAAVGQRHDEGPRATGSAIGVHDNGASAEVHLGDLARGELQAAGDLRGQLLAQPGHQAAHCRVAARPAVPALQRKVDGRAADALLEPAQHGVAVVLQARDGRSRPARRLERPGDVFVPRQCAAGLQPALGCSNAAPVASLAPAHDARRRDVPI